ncbi:hypothetical protein PanWU01x14_094830, partial [Parasponia andersonii]
LRLFLGKLKSSWSGPSTVVNMCPYSAIEVEDTSSNQRFKVNGQRLNEYLGEEIDQEKSSITLANPQ